MGHISCSRAVDRVIMGGVLGEWKNPGEGIMTISLSVYYVRSLTSACRKTVLNSDLGFKMMEP